MLAYDGFPYFTEWFDDLEVLRRHVNGLFTGFSGQTPAQVDSGAFPALNVVEEEDKVFVDVELPGVDPAQIEISVHGDTFTLSGERKPEESGDAELSYYRRERGIGKFSKSFSLPFELNPDGVQARYKNGLLKIELPKAESAKVRRISVLNG